MERGNFRDDPEQQVRVLNDKIDQLKDAEKLNYTLFDIASAVNTTRNVEELSARIHASLCRLIHLPNFFIAVYNAKKEVIEFLYCVDQKCEYSPIKEDLRHPKSLTGKVIAARKPLFFREAYLSERERQKKTIGAAPKIWLGVPLIVRKKVIGAIAVQDYEDPGCFSIRDMELLTAVSDQIAIAIERKQIFEALEKNERTLRLIAENTSSMIVIIDRQGVYEYVNPAHESIGYTAEELIGKASFDFIHPQDLTNLLGLLEKGLNREITHVFCQFRVKTKAGEYHFFEGTFDAINDTEGNLEKIIFIGEDTTQRKQTEKALQETEEKFQLIFQTSPDAMVISRLEDGVIVDVNDSFTTHTKIQKQEAVGQQVIDLGIWSDKETSSRFISRLNEPGEISNYEMVLNLDGKKRSILISTQVIHLGHIPHAIMIARDVSEYKRIEAELRQRQKMDSIGTLAAGIAHDFNNILAGIIGSLDLLATGRDDFKPEYQENIDNAITSSRRAAKLIKQLQIFAKRSDSKKTSVDLYAIAGDVFDILKQTTSPLIEKHLDFPKGQFFVCGYEDELYQVMMNLCMNGIQAIEEKEALFEESICISVSVPDKKDIQLHMLPDQEYLHLRFQDTGPGMDEETRQRAFDPMFSTKQMGDQKGQGLGLAIVYNIITRKHNGAVFIDTQKSGGTCIHIYLPRAEKKQVRNEKYVETVGGHETILVIEDEEIVRKVAVKALNLFGYETLEAGDGINGLEMFKAHRDSIDAVLLDLIMPGKSGGEVLKEMLDMDPDVRVIIASGQISNQDPVEVLNNARAYIGKPYRMKELKAVIRQVLS